MKITICTEIKEQLTFSKLKVYIHEQNVFSKNAPQICPNFFGYKYIWYQIIITYLPPTITPVSSYGHLQTWVLGLHRDMDSPVPPHAQHTLQQGHVRCPTYQMMSCSTGPELYTVSSPAGETDASNLEPVEMFTIIIFMQ